MANPPNLTQISFAGGLDESVHSEVLDPATSFRVLQNVRQDRVGGAGKRLGTQPLARTRLDGTTRTGGRKLLSLRGAPVVIDDTPAIDSYVESLAKATVPQRVSECTYKLTPIVSTPVGSTVSDSELCNGLLAVAYTNGVVSVVDATTFVTVTAPPFPFTDSGTTSVSSCGGRYFIVAAHDVATSQIRLAYFDTQSISSGWTTMTAITGATGKTVMCSNGARALLAHSTGAGFSVKGITQAGVVDSTSATVASLTAIDIALSTDLSLLWVVYATTTTATVYAGPPTSVGTVTVTATTVAPAPSNPDRIAILPTNAGTSARIFANENPTTTRREFFSILVTVTGSTPSFSLYTFNEGASMASKPLVFNGRTLMAMVGAPVAQSSTDVSQNTLVVVDATDMRLAISGGPLYLRPIANIEPGLALSAAAKLQPVGSTLLVPFGALATRLTGVTSPVTRSLIARLDFASLTRWPNVESRNTLFFGGALLSTWDGTYATEVGFIHAPSQPTTTLAATGITGTYRYVAVYEDVDAAGQYVVSGVSAPSALVTATNQNVTIRTCGLSLSSRLKSSLAVAFYRTLSGGAPPYYRLGSVSFGYGFGAIYSEATTDAVLATQPKLYAPNLPGTAGESLDRRAPPGLVDIASYNGMLVGVKGDSVIYSGQPVYGESTWFNPVFEIPISGGGDFVGLDVLDGTLFLFKSTRIYSIAGDPPADNGGSGGLGNPRLLASDVGCISPNSIVSTSAGTFFQSTRGIELLDRGGTVSYVGFKVSRTLATYPVVTAAVLDARNSLVRISLASSVVAGVVSGAGVDIVYDLKLGVWMGTDDKTGQSAHEASQDANVVTIGGVTRYAWLGTGGYVYVESLETDSGAYLDGTTYVARAAESSNFRLSGIQGTQQVNQVMLLERRATDHDASIALAYNYESAFRTATPWTAATIGANLTAGWPVTQLKHQPHDDAICQGIRIRITDTAPSSGTVGNGQGSTWLALSLDITPKAGIFDVPDIAT